MKETVQTFASALLDHVRTSTELDIILNYDPDPTVDAWEPGERPTLERLKLSTKYKLKVVSIRMSKLRSSFTRHRLVELDKSANRGENSRGANARARLKILKDSTWI